MKLLMFVIILLCVSCKGGGGSSAKSNPPTVEITNIAEAFTGMWAKCENDTSDNTSVLYVYSASTNALVSSYLFYSALGCHTADIVYDEKFVNKVVKSGDTYHTTLVGASSTSLASFDVTYNNTNSYCGYSNWVINVPKDLLSRNCGGNTSSAGDTGTFTLSRSGANLLITGSNGPLDLQPISSPSFNHSGTAISNGSYSFINNDIAYLFIFNDGLYTSYAYDTVARKYYSENGTYSVNQNLVTFTLASSIPDCGSSAGENWSLYYSPNLNLPVIFKNVRNEILTAETTSWTEAQFRSSYAGSGFVQGCI